MGHFAEADAAQAEFANVAAGATTKVAAVIGANGEFGLSLRLFDKGLFSQTISSRFPELPGLWRRDGTAMRSFCHLVMNGSVLRDKRHTKEADGALMRRPATQSL